jgi:hypothetical protein
MLSFYRILSLCAKGIAVFFNVVIPLTHHKNGGFTELKVVGVWRSIILLFTAFSAGVLKG